MISGGKKVESENSFVDENEAERPFLVVEI